MIYAYYERDYYNNDGSLPMTKEHYEALLSCCFQYASFFSFVVKNSRTPIMNELAEWAIKDTKTAAGQENALSYFCVCEQTYTSLSKWAQSVFDFDAFRNPLYPEDLTFYRTDGSIFMESIAHEGECTLHVQPGEDVLAVLAFGNWLPLGEDGRPQVPAASIDLRLPPGTNITGDHLYKQLMELKANPYAYIAEATLEALEKWILNYWPPNLGERFDLPFNANVLPKWYIVFSFDILSQCNALTTDSVGEAMRSVGWTGKTGFDKFFFFLEQFIQDGGRFA